MNGDGAPGTAARSFPGNKESIAQVRSWGRAWMEECGVAKEVIENAVLVLSELTTNAAVHSRSSGPHGSYLVRLRRGMSMLRLEVTDTGGTTEPRARRHNSPGIEEGGNGLALVDAFTSRWWTRGGTSGRTVGAELPLNGSA